MEEIREIARQARRSLSPSVFTPSAHKKFQQELSATKKEKQADKAFDTIEGSVNDYHCRSGHIPFTNLRPLTDGTLTAPNPDVYHGSRPEDINVKVCNELQYLIIPSTQTDLPVLPNCFVAVKGPDENLRVAEIQARYDGAIGARAMHALQTWGQTEKMFDGNAYTIASVFSGGTLKLYTTHPVEVSGRDEYVMTVIETFTVDGSRAKFLEAVTAYRNLRDWAKDCRDTFVEAANSSAGSRMNNQLNYATPPTEDDLLSQPSVR